MEALQDIRQPQSGEAIVLSGLTKTYGDFVAVNRLDLTVAKGEIFGLLGPNGAGKTTTILMMLGLTEPTGGDVRVLGLDPRRSSLQVKRRIGYMPDDIGFYEDRTALDNLIYTARLNGISLPEATARAKELLNRVGLAEAARKKTGQFSRGMRQRLGLADVLIKRPDIIILDEPTLGIDPEGVRELLELIRSLSREEGLTVLLSSHHLHQVQQVCDRVGLFVKGRLVACGNLEQLSQALDEDRTVTVDLEIAAWNDGLQEAVGRLEEVLSIDSRQASSIGGEGRHAVTVVCSRDITPQIARLVSEKGELYAISRRQYGLDDIYHKYFEGGEHHGSR